MLCVHVCMYDVCTHTTVYMCYMYYTYIHDIHSYIHTYSTIILHLYVCVHTYIHTYYIHTILHTSYIHHTYIHVATHTTHSYMSRQEQKPDFWVPSSKKVRAEKIQIFSDLKKIYSSLQIRKIEIFYDPQKISNLVISPLQLSTDFTT